MKTWFVLPPVLLSLTGIGCSRPEAKSAAPTLLTVAYEVKDRTTNSVIMSGQSAVTATPMQARDSSDKDRTATFEMRGGGWPDGSTVVHVNFREDSRSGRHIQWQPSVRITPGNTATAEFTTEDAARTLTLRAE